MTVSVKTKSKKVKSYAVAVRTAPPLGIERSVDYHRIDDPAKPFDCVEVDGIAVYRVFRGGVVVASYPAPTVVSCRLSSRKFRTDKVTHVRVIQRIEGA